MASAARYTQAWLIVLAETLTIALKARIAEFAMSSRLPMIAELREFTGFGRCCQLRDQSTCAGGGAPRRAKPRDLPVEQPTTFEMVLNLESAKSLDLEIPLRQQQLADEVIE